jgi:hypothetical protein
MKIDIMQISGKKIVTRADGEKINNILSEKWNTEKIININFDNVLVASVSFMDEAFGKLALKYDREALKNKLKFTNIVDYDRALLNDILISRYRQKDELEKHGTMRGRILTSKAKRLLNTCAKISKDQT